MMMRSMPLVLVLIAFWLGRETAAEGEQGDDPKISKFGVIKAEYLIVDLIRVRSAKPEGGSRYVTIGNGRIEIHDSRSGGASLGLGADKIEIGGGAGRYLNIDREGMVSYDPSAKDGEPVAYIGVMKPVKPEKKRD